MTQDELRAMKYDSMTIEQFIELLAKAANSEAAQAVADVGAMLGMSAGMEPTKGQRTIGNVRGRYTPKTEMGRQIQAIVERALADAKAKREARKQEGGGRG